MKCLRIIPITSKGILQLQKYIESTTNPSVSDRLRMFKARQITKLIYKGMPEPKMLREEWDEKTIILSIIVEDDFEQYADELLENCKINFLKVVKSSEEHFKLEVF